MSFKEASSDLLKYVFSGNKDIEILPIWVYDSTRTGKRKPATLTIAVPDGYVKNIRGDKPEDVYLIVKIPHSVNEEFVNWKGSPDSIKRATGITIE